MNFSRITKTIGIAVLSMVSLSSFAQDIIARQAPSDKRLKDIHNVKLNTKVALSSADLNDPASNIYMDWTDNLRSCTGSVPSNYKIDLRGFCMPTPSRKINSPFGPRWGRQHKGIDVKVYTGDTIYAAFDGKVRITKYNAGGWGYYVVIRHPNGLETLYGHLSKQLVRENQIVHAGEPIGLGGSTGDSTGSHLHFETRLLGQAVNPALMFDFERQDVTGDFYIVRTGTVQNKKAPTNTAVAANTAPRAAQKPAAEVARNTVESQKTITSSHPQTASHQEAAVAGTPRQASAAATTEITYVVKDGDNLFRIAQNHGLTLDQLCRLNGLKPNSLIVRGQVLKCS